MNVINQNFDELDNIEKIFEELIGFVGKHLLTTEGNGDASIL
jgi:hypothetical protein